MESAKQLEITHAEGSVDIFGADIMQVIDTERNDQ